MAKHKTFRLHLNPDWREPSGDGTLVEHKPCAYAWAFSGKSIHWIDFWPLEEAMAQRAPWRSAWCE
jgi:hypothetical protein